MGNSIERPDWQKDEEVEHCTACTTEFGALTRKHHCRSCGRIFCNTCSSHEAFGARVCKECFELGNNNYIAAKELVEARLRHFQEFEREELPADCLLTLQYMVDEVLKKMVTLPEARQIAFVADMIENLSSTWDTLSRKDLFRDWNLALSSVMFPPTIRDLDDVMVAEVKDTFEPGPLYLDVDTEAWKEFMENARFYYFDHAPITEMRDVMGSLDGTRVYVSAQALQQGEHSDLVPMLQLQFQNNLITWLEHIKKAEPIQEERDVSPEQEINPDTVTDTILTDAQERKQEGMVDGGLEPVPQE